ncbi:uncharacterized protein LOC127286207 [Leptopilina boulardi]|uniref:uncharacterized protein LOC127286207 n=1 Tax=Leptopilina boulardi TaxID=63433 RepID=UPI0021F6245D|nr:uncharacterized protein LOC127286207 [Leptopilina boulardi]
MCCLKYYSFFYRSDIERHVKSERHIASCKEVKSGNVRTMQIFLANNAENKEAIKFENQVKYAELKLCGFFAAHNEAFMKMDHLLDVLKQIFPDSKIVQGISCKRTKTKGVIMNVLGVDEKENLVSVLKKNKFSILVDESTDISSVKTFCILVRFYAENCGKILSRFWDLQQVFTESDPDGAEEGATARRLFTIMKKTFDKHQIPFANVVGFGSDGCNTMMGGNNSVASRMTELCPGLRVCKCLCHSLHLCASEACKCLPRSTEDLTRNIYNFFKTSAKRRAQFSEFQSFVEVDVLRMLHPSQTRWLSLTSVINRILNQWEALRLFFDAKWFEERLESVERIHVLLNDAATKAFYLFLQWVLPKVTSMNELFQSEKSVVTVVHDKMNESYYDLLACFMKRNYIHTTPANEINPTDESKWLPLNQLYLGIAVSNQLLLPELIQRPEVVHDIKFRCRLFLITLCDQLKKRFDFDDPVLMRLKLFAPATALSQRERESTPSLQPLMVLMPRIIGPNDPEKMQEIDDQWRTLPFQRENFQDLRDLKNPEDFWHQVNIFKDEIGDRPFSTLAWFALEVLSIPIANADCERVFSKINDVKTKKRNKLITSTVCGLLHADTIVRDSGNCCIAFQPRQSMYDRMISSNIYRSVAENEEEFNDIDNIFAEA